MVILIMMNDDDDADDADDGDAGDGGDGGDADAPWSQTETLHFF